MMSKKVVADVWNKNCDLDLDSLGSVFDENRSKKPKQIMLDMSESEIKEFVKNIGLGDEKTNKKEEK